LKTTSSILLLFILFLAFAGPGIYFPVVKSVHRQKMHEWIKDKPLQHFTRLEFSREDAAEIYLEDGKEFELAGKRYDIISAHAAGNKIVVYCINDSDEEMLYANESGSKRKAREIEIIKSLNLLLFISSRPIEITAPAGICLVMHMALYVDHYRNFKSDIISPPPQA
jgi:hypothetical protein